MHGPSFWLRLRVNCEQATQWKDVVPEFYGGLLDRLHCQLIEPKSMEITIPGEALHHKFDGSIDGRCAWSDSIDLPLLPGERVAGIAGVTTIDDTTGLFRYSRDKDSILQQLAIFFSRAQQLTKRTDEKRHLVTNFSCWGLTKCTIYDDVGQRLEQGWFLRERLAHRGRYTPILRMFVSHGIGDNLRSIDF